MINDACESTRPLDRPRTSCKRKSQTMHHSRRKRHGLLTPRVPHRPVRLVADIAALTLIALSLVILFEDGKANAEDKVAAKPGQAAEISRGGRLYDNHWSTSSQRIPSTRNPEYPPGEPPQGLTTWRCVSCHGWDYLGSAGHLGKTGPGFPPIRTAVGRPPQEIAGFFKNSPEHQKVLAGLPDGELDYLALFLCCGQHDINALLDGEGNAKGDPLKGQDIYENSCSRCHQADGKAPLYGESGDVSSLGWIARERPEQALHKIRNGVPNADMLSLRFLRIEQIGDLLAYLQGLE